MRCRRGAIAVFLSIIFASMMMVIATLVNAGAYITSRNMAEAATDLAGRSILAGYDKQLRLDYGLFAFAGEPASLERSIVDDLAYSFGTQGGSADERILDILMLDVASADVSLAAYSLGDVSIFESQLAQQMQYMLLADPGPAAVSRIKELADAALLVQLTERTAAIMKELTAFSSRIKAIADAREAMDRSEQELKELLTAGQSGGMDGFAARLGNLLLDVRKSNSVIVYNVDQIRHNLTSFRKNVAEARALCERAQSEQGWKAAGAMSDVLKKTETALDKIQSIYSDDWRSAYMENAALLREFEKALPLTDEARQRFVSGYHWELALTPMDLVDIEKLTGLFDKKDEGKNAAAAGSRTVMKGETSEADRPRVLRNGIVLDSLPSDRFADNTAFLLPELPPFEGLGDLQKFFRNGKDLVLSDLYITHYMNNHSMQYDKTRNFFRNEVEYILYGNPDDAENYEELKRDFLALRTALNIIHVYGDSEKRGQAAAVAAGLVPGPYAGLGEFAVILAWSAAESANDLGLIEKDHGVPLIKQKRDWALSIDAILAGFSGETILPGTDDQTWRYNNYLLVFLLFADRSEKILRTMDIIQINMQGRYDKEFRIIERYCGFSYDILLERKPLLPAFGKFLKTVIELEGRHVY